MIKKAKKTKSKTGVQRKLSYGSAKPSYRAVENNGTRRRISPQIFSEERHLDKSDRQTLVASTADLYRNCGIITFAVDRRLDATTSFSFQVKSGDKAFDRAVETRMAAWSAAKNCDISERFTFSEMVRLAEKTRLMGGDCLIIKCEGQRLQLVEADMIANPDVATDAINVADYTQGLKINPLTGRIEEYLICDRGANGTQKRLLARVAPENAIFLAYRPRASAWRGVSPLAPVINAAKDMMDSQAYNLMKIRLTSLLGFKFTRQGDEDLGAGLTPSTDEPANYDIDLTSEKPMVFDLQQGDDVSVIESGTPATEVQNYYEVMTMQVLRALGIPMSFYKENFSTYVGSKAAALAFQKTCIPIQNGIIEALDNITRWLIAGWILSGELQLPENLTPNQISFEWVPSGMGLWKPAEEMMGLGMAIALGQTTLSDAAREGGGDFFQNIDRIKEELQYAKEAGVTITLPNISSNINIMPDATVSNQ